jgi:integrase/recombinase XerD
VRNPGKVSCHWLRHAHGSHAAERGVNPVLIKDTLGHSNLAITDRYLKARPNDSSALKLMDGYLIDFNHLVTR